MEKQFQILGAAGNTYGIYPAMSPEAALDKWAAECGWTSWDNAKKKTPDLFPGFTLNGDKIILT